MIFCDLFNQCI